MKNTDPNSHTVAIALMSLFLIPLIMMFQNCAAPEGEIANEGETSASSTALFTEEKAFPFEISANYISYMSCTNMDKGHNPEAFHSFKIGAYNDTNSFTKHGLSLTEEFQEAIKFYDDTEEALAVLVNRFPLIDSVFVQAGLNKQGSLMPTGEELHNNSALPALDNHLVLRKLLSQRSTPVSYFNNVKGLSGRKLEASIHAMHLGEASHRELRTELSGSGSPSLLSLGFGPKKSQGYLLGNMDLVSSSTSSDNKAYGKGYKLQFTPGSFLNSDSSYPLIINYTPSNRTLASISETKLSDGSITSSQWSCPKRLKFMIVRDYDYRNDSVVRKNCEKKIYDARNLSSEDKAIYNILKPEHWYVDFEHRCIIAKRKGTSCYGKQHDSDPSKSVVNYFGVINGSTNCDGLTLTTGNRPVLCPQYASICHKTN